eukprot:c23587_g1_i2 orf=404-1735(-)
MNIIESIGFMDVPPYRDHAVANVIHGLIFYNMWHELAIQDLKVSLRSKLDHVPDDMNMGLLEEVGENGDVDDCSSMHDGCSERESSRDILEVDLASKKSAERDEVGLLKGHCKSNLHDSHKISSQGFYSDMDEEQERIYLRTASILCTPDMDKQLFPVHLPKIYHGHVYMIPMRTPRILGHYTNAVKHLRQALNEVPHLAGALVPLVQLLLAAPDVESAYMEIDKCCQASDHILPFRIKCELLESLVPKNTPMLVHSYEEILDRDASSEQAIKALIHMHDIGEYCTVTLVEYLAHHLDGSWGSGDVWEKLANIFLQFSKVKENISKDVPEVGCNGAGSKSLQCFPQHNVRSAWKERCTWWPYKHFKHGNINQEQNQNGGSQILAYKAACAAHIFGSDWYYVTEVRKKLNEINNATLCTLLEEHTQQSLNLLALLVCTTDVRTK